MERKQAVKNAESVKGIFENSAEGRRKRARLMLIAIFAAYCVALFFAVLKRTPYGDSTAYRSLLKPIPFETIRSQLRYARYSRNGELVRYGVKNLLGNFVLFLPMGIFLPCIFKKLRKAYKTIPLIMGMVVLVELLQIATKRGFADIDDLILNTVGAAAGYFIYHLVRHSDTP